MSQLRFISFKFSKRKNALLCGVSYCDGENVSKTWMSVSQIHEFSLK